MVSFPHRLILPYEPPYPYPKIFKLMSTQTIYNAVVTSIELGREHGALVTHLDIGSGSGALIALLQKRLGVQSQACDYTDSLMKLAGQQVDVANLNVDKLPYSDASFDLVTATEVIEHLEHYRETFREIFRVLKPGGVCVLTTPNVLNINSRFRYFLSGFANLFGPLPIKHSALYSTGGHINPVGYFYIAHSLYDAEFSEVTVTVDKWQRSGIWKLILLGPFLFLGAWFLWRKETLKYKTLTQENQGIVDQLNSLDLLLGRTVVVCAKK